MNLQGRYDGFLCDLIVLLEELAVRYITEKPVDLNKFKYYFNIFYDRMHRLEESFHQKKLKISTYLTRLKDHCSLDQKNTHKSHSKDLNNSDNKPSQTISNTFVRSISASKPIQKSRQLKSIRQQDDEHHIPYNNKRSQTVNGYRSASNHQSANAVRPKTGHIGNKNRYFQNQKTSKTINVTSQYLFDTEESQSKNQRIHYVLDNKQIPNKRKHFYEQLQKSKKIQFQPINQIQYRSLFKNSRKSSNKKWQKKISQLL